MTLRLRCFIVGTHKSKTMYKATLKVHFDAEWTYTGKIYDDETLPEEHYTFEIPTQDLNSIQLFRFFGNVARTMGHNDVGIMKGACALAFNDMRSQEDMRRVAEEYDLKLAEDYVKEFRKLEDQILHLKAELSRYEQPDNPNYTDEEMDAMCAEDQHKGWKGLVPGSIAATLMGCKCPVMDNEEMPDDEEWIDGDCPLHGKIK